MPLSGRMIDLDHRERLVNGITLHTVEAGSGTPVVLLHGFPEFWYSWRYQIDALVGAGLRFIAPDLRGYNRSAKPEGVAAYSIETVAQDVVALIDQLGEKAALVGHDWGGVVAWRVAKIAPHLLSSLTVLNIPHPHAVNEKKSSPKQAVRFWYQLALQPPAVPEIVLAARNFLALRRLLQQSVRRPGAVSERDLDLYVDAWRQRGALTGMLNYYRALLRRTPSRSAAATTPESPPPTMLVMGEHEPVFLRETLEASAKYLPTIRLELVASGGHFVHQDDPEAVNQLLIRFVRAQQG